jgi:SAM-dependent methyltransferase
VRDLLHGLPGEFDVVRCRNCRHCFLNPRPTFDALCAYYPPDYGPYHAPAAQQVAVQPSPATPWYLRRGVRAIPGLRRLYYALAQTHSVWIPPPPRPGARALELGCSDGWFLDRLQLAGWTPIGVELSAEPARRARDRGYEVHTGTLAPHMFSEQSFDACFAWMVLEHLPDPKETLWELRRLLRPGGWLAFSVPNFACWERYLFGRYWRGLEPPRHLQHFEPRRLRKLLREQGFRVERTIHQHNVLNLIASLGLVLKDKRPYGKWGPALLRFTDAPWMWPQLALSPLAIGLAWLRQGGRLTVIARPDG